MLEWSDPDKIVVSVDWTQIDDVADAHEFRRRGPRHEPQFRRDHRDWAGIARRRRAVRPPAATGGATGDRHLGDGIANFGIAPAMARDRITAEGIAINGLAILTEEPWLEDYYRREVVGGPAAFVLAARTFGDFAAAMERKLVQEVAGGAPADIPQTFSDTVGANRREAVEPDRGVARGISAGR